MATERDSEMAIDVPEGTPTSLQSEAAMHHPFGWYRTQREHGPVHYDPQRNVYDVFSYTHVKEALQDSETFTRKPLSGSHSDTQTPFSYLDNAMVWSDGSKHSDAKAQLFQYFRPSMLADLETSIREITADQLHVAMDDGTKFDFVSEFAVPVPLRVIMDVVGIPQADHEQMLAWLETFREVMNTEYSDKESRDGSLMTETVEYFRTLVTRRRRDPQDDLVSRLATETELSDAEIGSNCFDFILAGQGTMSELLANALFLFDDQGLLDEQPDHDVSDILEEVLRYRSPLQSRARVTTRPVTVGETDISAGETIILWLGAANRDPARFDRPETFVPDRDPEHLAFGTGAHSCIGAPLARLQAPIVLATFLDSVTAVTIDLDAAEPKWKPSKLGFEQLPVAVTPV